MLVCSSCQKISSGPSTQIGNIFVDLPQSFLCSECYKKQFQERIKEKGWHKESKRHSLAARGIKTKQKRYTLNIRR